MLSYGILDGASHVTIVRGWFRVTPSVGAAFNLWERTGRDLRATLCARKELFPQKGFRGKSYAEMRSSAVVDAGHHAA